MPKTIPKNMSEKMSKKLKKMEGEGEPSSAEQIGAKCILGLFMAGTIAMSNTMEFMGNRSLNTAGAQ